MAAETDDNKISFFRKPSCPLWITTCIMIIYAVWSVLVPILTVSGLLVNSRSFECNSREDLVAPRLTDEATLVYVWAGLSLPACIILLLELWRKKSFYVKMLPFASFLLMVIMLSTFGNFFKEEAQELKTFEGRYLALLPLTKGITQNQPTDTICNELTNVDRWQAEFNCCGIQSYQDWNSSIPDSCLCDGQGHSSACVGVGNSLVHEKPCLPLVLSLLKRRNSAFEVVMILWVTITAIPAVFCLLGMLAGCILVTYILIFEGCCYNLSVCMYKLRGGEEMVPVVFIRKNNNDQTEEENKNNGEGQESSKDDSVALDVEGGTNVEGDRQEVSEEDWDDNPVKMIPLSELRRLQEELDPPPVQHEVRCMCLLSERRRNFYTILLDEGSPLLPSGAVLVDANKPTRECCFGEGPHVFFPHRLVWPEERRHSSTTVALH